MRLVDWFLKFFQPPVKVPRRVKFVEGTEWLCSCCGTTIAIARRDIYTYDIDRSSDWDVKDSSFWGRRRIHCNKHLLEYDPGGRGALIFTPTGWVG